MNERPAVFDAGRPRVSGPIRRISRPLGPIALPIAGTRWLPFYSIVRHTGRTSGKAHSTPVVAIRIPDGFLIPLPFGDATQWAKNLFAAGRGRLQHGGREYEIDEPRVVGGDAVEAHLPRGVRFLARVLGLRQYVLVRRVSR
jgi:deazaflavin-dependent oxidoreductase (nitroreductase family)